MSFYGQVLYEFTKLFNTINVSNSTVESTAEDAPAKTQTSLQAAEQWDHLNIAGGNRWIELTTNNDTKTLTVSHSKPGEADSSKTVVGFQKIAETDVPEDATITQLVAQDCIKTTINQYDSAGHAVDASTSYFKLPISATELALEDIESRVGIIENNHFTFDHTEENAEDYTPDEENNGLSIKSYLTHHGYLDSENVEAALAEYLEENAYTTTDLTGTLNTIYTQEYDFLRPGATPGADDSLIARYPTLTETIGQMDGDEESVLSAMRLLQGLSSTDEDYDKRYTLSEAIQLLVEAQQSINAKLTTYAYAIQGFDARIKALEEGTSE